MHKREVDHKQPLSGFELWTQIRFPPTIIVHYARLLQEQSENSVALSAKQVLYKLFAKQTQKLSLKN